MKQGRTINELFPGSVAQAKDRHLCERTRSLRGLG